MNILQQLGKFVMARPQGLIDNASATVIVCDARGVGGVCIDCMIGATDIALTALNLQHGDAVGGPFTTIATWGTTLNIEGVASTLPAATSDGGIYTFEVDMRGKKPFLNLVATFGDGSAGGYFAALAQKADLKYPAILAAARGCTEIIRI